VNFSSPEFLFIFLPTATLLFYVLPLWLRLTSIGAASVVFYGMTGPIPLIAFVLTTIWAFLFGLIVDQIKRNWVLWIGIGTPLLVLFLFKYLNFFFDFIGATTETRNLFQLFTEISLPPAISFYTFQVIAYIVDVRDRKIPVETNFIRLGTFISFFAQLIAGPILRYANFRDQLTHISLHKITPRLAPAIKYITAGFFYKILFADALRALQESFFLETGGGSLDALFSILSYTFVIYYDFWAYSLMAIGLALLFGIEFPRNFREPYLSASPKEFWRRWHVTLSFFLRDYVYMRLGGNSHYVRNILIIFLACGMWHGAGWNFIVWGLYHAVLVILYHYVRPAWDSMPRVIQTVLTFSLVAIGWPMFYLDFPAYIAVLTELFAMQGPGGNSLQFGFAPWIYLLLVSALCFGTREDKWLFSENRVPVIDSPLFQGMVLGVTLLFINLERDFIYFAF